MSELYRIFAADWQHVLDFSDEALVELYNYESYGGSTPAQNNGFAHGKKWLNLHVSEWKEMIAEGLLFKCELYEDPKYANYHWWLDRVLANVRDNVIVWRVT